MSDPAERNPTATPRNSGDDLDSGVTAAGPGAERDTEPAREARDTELDGEFSPEPERTPVAGHAIPIESSRRPDEDTLLSAPRPADRMELLVEDKLSGFETRLDSLEARLATLEHKKQVEPREGNANWGIWVFLLIALAIGWKALEVLK
jgi:hypothetical protein